MSLNNETALKCHLKFDETGTVTTAQDSTSNNHDGTLVSTPTDGTQWVTGKHRGGLYRAAAGSMTVANHADLIGTTYTIAFWLKVDSIPVSSIRVMGKYSGTDTRQYTIFLQLAGNLSYSTRYDNAPTGVDVGGSTTLQAGKWHHIAMSCTGTSMIGYVDGVADISATDVTDKIATDSNAIQFTNSSVIGMYFDDFRQYDRVLDITEIKTLYNVPYFIDLNHDPALLYHAKLDETSGTGVIDEVGYSTTYLSGLPSDDSQWITGKYGNGVERTSGGTNYLRVNDEVRLQLGVYTYAFWTKMASKPISLHTIVSKADSHNRNPAVYLIAASGAIKWSNKVSDVTKDWDCTSNVCDGEWHHVAGVTDGTSLWVYVDGVQEQYEADVTTWLGGYTTAIVLFMSGAGGYTAGMDDIRIYNRALSLGEVHILAEKPYTNNDLNTDPSLNMHFKFDEASGTTGADSIKDSARDLLHGTPTGSPGFGVSGKLAKAFDTNTGSGDYITLKDPGNSELQKFTFAGWYKFSGSGTQNLTVNIGGTCFIRMGGTYDYIGLKTVTGTQLNHYFDSNLSTGIWYHLALVRNEDDVVTLYVDGVAQIDTEINAGEFQIRYLPAWAWTADMLMDDIRFYGRDLSEDEITTLMSPYASNKRKKLQMLGA